MRKWMRVGLATLGVALLLACGAPSGSNSGGKKFGDGSKTEQADSTPSRPETYVPEPADFKLAAKITRKKCFGSAGCNIDYQIELVGYTGKDLDPSTEYEVTYEVSGGEDGPQINTFTVTGDRYQVEKDESISTDRSGIKLTAKATDVSEV